MSAAPGTAPAYAVKIPQTSAGRLSYALRAAEWQLLSLTFTLNAAAASGGRTALVGVYAPNGAVIAQTYIAVTVPAGSVGYFSLAPHLNPCDSFTAGTSVFVTDTFPSVVLATDCELRVQAVNATSGAATTDALLSDGIAWVSDVGAADAASLAPLLVPAPLALSGISTSAGG